MRREVVLLPGDGFMVECQYDTRNRSKTTFGGLASTDEMCTAMLMIYPKMDFPLCMSMPNVSSMASLVGGRMDPTYSYLVEPVQYRNWTWKKVAESIKWTPSLVARLQELLYAPGTYSLYGCMSFDRKSAWPKSKLPFYPRPIPPRRSISELREVCTKGTRMPSTMAPVGSAPKSVVPTIALILFVLACTAM